MKNITEIQLAIQQKLEQQLRDLYALDAKVASLEPDSAQSIESLEQTLVEEVKSRSLKLTRHLARSEHNTKELIRLELEQERLKTRILPNSTNYPPFKTLCIQHVSTISHWSKKRQLWKKSPILSRLNMILWSAKRMHSKRR